MKDRRIAAVVLAAGQSTRMGNINKLLSPVGGKAMLLHAIDAALQAGLSPVLAVSGHERERIENLLLDTAVSIVHNENYRDGIASSIRKGIESLPPDADAAMILLGDMPYVQPGHLRKLAEGYNSDDLRKIFVPYFNNKRGNPVLWDRTLFPDLCRLSGDRGARVLLDKYRSLIYRVPMDDAAIHKDIDEP